MRISTQRAPMRRWAFDRLSMNPLLMRGVARRRVTIVTSKEVEPAVIQSRYRILKCLSSLLRLTPTVASDLNKGDRPKRESAILCQRCFDLLTRSHSKILVTIFLPEII